MEQPVVDRRQDARFRELRAMRATLRPGHLVALIDLSAGGALVQAERPLRPGARVHLQLVTDGRQCALPARVVRCAVWAVDADRGVIYRGALQFDQRCDLSWESATPDGSPVPRSAGPDPGRVGQQLPATGAAARGRPGRVVR